MNNKITVNYIGMVEVGQAFKNYKTLCEYLGEDVKTSNSKTAQEKNWERYFSWEKISRYGLQITEIHEVVKDKFDNRKGGNNTVNYIDKIEKSILRMLSRREDGESVFLSKNKLLKELNVVNGNYVDSKYKPAKLSSITEISRDEISDFYQTSDSLLYRNVESALKRLRSKALLVFESVVTVGHVETYAVTNNDGDVKAVKKVITDKYGDQTFDITASESAVDYIDYRRATKEEKEIILATEHATLQKYKYDTPRDAFLAGKFSEFYDEISEYLFEEYNIYMYFNSYEITFNKDNVLDALEKLNSADNESVESQELLNKEIIERMTLNAKNRSESSKMKLAEKPRNRRHLMRSSFNYLSNHKKLIDTLVDLKADRIE